MKLKKKKKKKKKTSVKSAFLLGRKPLIKSGFHVICENREKKTKQTNKKQKQKQKQTKKQTNRKITLFLR